MGNPINAQVLIVGGGPVGLTLAIDLAQRGVHVTVAEIRAGAEPPSVKCNHVAVRTMEIFRPSGASPRRARIWPPSRISQRRCVPHDRDWDGAVTHSDSVSC
jgi:2-polyprenyl-6-methoxyphenol hydroxylase-like FAD-dependent oxidoreductase